MREERGKGGGGGRSSGERQADGLGRRSGPAEARLTLLVAASRSFSLSHSLSPPCGAVPEHRYEDFVAREGSGG